MANAIASWRAHQFAPILSPPADPFPIAADAVALLHDPLTVASLIGGDWLHLRHTSLTASLGAEGFRLREDPVGMPATIADAVDGDAFATFCLDRITQLLT